MEKVFRVTFLDENFKALTATTLFNSRTLAQLYAQKTAQKINAFKYVIDYINVAQSKYDLYFIYTE